MNIKHILILSCTAGALASCVPVVITPPSINAPSVRVANIRVLPSGYRTVNVSGIKYYTHGGKYWKRSNGVYVPVRKPVVKKSKLFIPPGHRKVVKVKGNKHYR